MSDYTHEEMVEDIAADFDEKLEAKDFKGCEAMIDGLKESGYAREAAYLTKKLQQFRGETHTKQVADLEAARKAEILSRPMQDEVEGEEEDPRDISDRSGIYPY